MDEVLMKWARIRKEKDELERKIEKCRKSVQNYMVKHDMKTYENDLFKVKINTQNRSFMLKSSVPEDIWKQYSVSKPIETILLTEKKRKEVEA